MRACFVVVFCLSLTAGGVAQEGIPSDQPHHQCSPPLVPMIPLAHLSAAAPLRAHDEGALVSDCDIPFSERHRTVTVPRSDPGLDTRSWYPFDLRTIGVQTLFGAIGAGIFTAVGYGAIRSGGFENLGAGMVVMYLGGSLVGVPIGVLFGGEVMGGEASTAAVFTGSALGTATGIIALSSARDYPAANAMYIAASFVGPLLGYHLSATSSEERARRDGLEGLTLRQHTGARHRGDVVASRPPIDPLTPGPDFQLALIALQF